MRMKPIVIILSVVLVSFNNKRATDIVGDIYDAIRREDVGRVKSTLAADTNAVNFVGEKAFTLLHFAAQHGSSNGTEILKLLLANGADIEAKNHIGQTPLSGAAIYDNPGGAKILIAHGAKVNVRQASGGTA